MLNDFTANLVYVVSFHFFIIHFSCPFMSAPCQDVWVAGSFPVNTRLTVSMGDKRRDEGSRSDGCDSEAGECRVARAHRSQALNLKY